MKNIIFLLFTVRVLMPMNVRIYENVSSWADYDDNIYVIRLKDGSKVWVPKMFSIIEEKR
jgi:hypothetical protein